MRALGAVALVVVLAGCGVLDKKGSGSDLIGGITKRCVVSFLTTDSTGADPRVHALNSGQCPELPVVTSPAGK